jgi:hypothetical protein
LRCIYRDEEENGGIAEVRKNYSLASGCDGLALWVINAPEGLHVIHKLWWKMFGKEICPSGNKFPAFGK